MITGMITEIAVIVVIALVAVIAVVILMSTYCTIMQNHGRPQEEGKSRQSRPPSSPPLEFFLLLLYSILRAFLLLFLHMEAFLLRFSHYGGHFCSFFLHGGGLSRLAPPPPLPYENFCGRSCVQCETYQFINIADIDMAALT